MNLEDLLGEHILSGVDFGAIPNQGYYKDENVNFMLFCLDGKNLKAIENPDDGYRSMLESINEVSDEISNTFPPNTVIGIWKPNDLYNKNTTIQLLDIRTNFVVLEVGTDNTDDYYPVCVLYFNPKALSVNNQ